MTERPHLRPLMVMLVVVLVASAAVAGFSVHKLREAREVQRVRAQGLNGGVLPQGLDRKRAPAFRLKAARGGTIDAGALRGRPYALTVLYTRCPDVCPLIGQELNAALRELGADNRRVDVIAISVDPHGDTAAAVRSWLRRQDMPRNFRYAIGNTRELEPVWKAYYAAPQIPGRPETSTHTASVWLIDAEGRLRAKYSAGIPIDPQDLAEDFRTLLAETPSE